MRLILWSVSIALFIGSLVACYWGIAFLTASIYVTEPIGIWGIGLCVLAVVSIRLSNITLAKLLG